MRLTALLAAASLALGAATLAAPAAHATAWEASNFSIGCGGTLNGQFDTDATGQVTFSHLRESGGCTPGDYSTDTFQAVNGYFNLYNIATDAFSMSSVYFGDNIFLQFVSDLVGPTGTTIQIVPTAQGGSFKLDGYGDFIGITSGQVTALPEPASWGLMLLGFGGLGAALRRRRAGLALAAA
jgi:hypothetical protein